MKVNKILSIFIIITVILFPKTMTVEADEQETANELNPLIYKKLRFKQNTDYLHDTGKTEMKNTIPVKQFDINFDGSKRLPKRDDTSYLFQSATRGEKSTVSARTAELDLFNEETTQKLEPILKQDDVKPSNASMRTWLYIGMIGIGILFLFTFLLPRLMGDQGTGRKIN